MRYAPEQQHENRATIVAAARRLFKEKGYSGVGMDAIATAAGLTSGALYSQFASKQALFDAILEAELADFPRRWLARQTEDTAKWLDQWSAGYLSIRHRNNVANGCVLPSLSIDAARAGEGAQQIYEDLLLAAVDELQNSIPAGDGISSRERLWALLSLFTGGILLARATRTKETAAQILAACRKLATQLSSSAADRT